MLEDDFGVAESAGPAESCRVNVLEIVPRVERTRYVLGPKWRVSCRLLVDGAPVPGAHPDDIGCLRELQRTIRDGRFFVLNCNCGNFGCGGYYDGVEVSHSTEGTVGWTNLDSPKSPKMTFNSNQVIAAIATCVDSIRQRLMDLRGQHVEFVCWDDAEVFGIG